MVPSRKLDGLGQGWAVGQIITDKSQFRVKYIVRKLRLWETISIKHGNMAANSIQSPTGKLSQKPTNNKSYMEPS